MGGSGRERGAGEAPEPRQEIVQGEGFAQHNGGGETERGYLARGVLVVIGDTGEEGDAARSGIVGEDREGRPVQRGRGGVRGHVEDHGHRGEIAYDFMHPDSGRGPMGLIPGVDEDGAEEGTELLIVVKHDDTRGHGAVLSRHGILTRKGHAVTVTLAIDYQRITRMRYDCVAARVACCS